MHSCSAKMLLHWSVRPRF